MYGGRLPIPAVKVEDMSTTNREDGKTTIVVLASEPSYSAFGNMVRKWLVCAICALAAVAMNAMWITANAYGDNSSDSSDSSSSSTDSGVTITENITDTENLLGSHAAEVTDAIAKTEKETGVHVHLLYLSSFNSQQKPGDWAATVMESMNPKPNTVMLAVASNDGNLVVVVSKNSDKWLLDNKTVDKLSEAAQQPLLENPPSWSGAATAMMDQIVKSKKASTSSSRCRFFYRKQRSSSMWRSSFGRSPWTSGRAWSTSFVIKRTFPPSRKSSFRKSFTTAPFRVRSWINGCRTSGI